MKTEFKKSIRDGKPGYRYWVLDSDGKLLAHGWHAGTRIDVQIAAEQHARQCAMYEGGLKK